MLMREAFACPLCLGIRLCGRWIISELNPGYVLSRVFEPRGLQGCHVGVGWKKSAEYISSRP